MIVVSLIDSELKVNYISNDILMLSKSFIYKHFILNYIKRKPFHKNILKFN